jgi:hypothetical protein
MSGKRGVAPGISVTDGIMTMARMSLLLGTPLGEEAWREHFEIVAALRRVYVRSTFWHGLFLGAITAINVPLLGPAWYDYLLTAIMLFGGLWSAREWGRFIRSTVSPFGLPPRHNLPRVSFVLVYVGTLIADRVWQLETTRGIGCGIAVMLSWWLSGLLELRRRIPEFPPQWRVDHP